jgi:hypothetical protein
MGRVVRLSAIGADALVSEIVGHDEDKIRLARIGLRVAEVNENRDPNKKYDRSKHGGKCCSAKKYCVPGIQ